MTKKLERRSDDAEVERRYRLLFENMAEGFVVCEAIRDRDGRMTDYWVRAANPAFLRRSTYLKDYVGRRQKDVRPTTSDRWFAVCNRALEGQAVRFEYEEVLTGRWFDVHMMRLSDTEFGQFWIDITERKRSERRQAELFNELNHRVKNNLAVVSSMLELQAGSAPPEVAEPLLKAVDRIRSIADLHTMLYVHNSDETVELAPYVDGLCRRLSESLFAGDVSRVTASCDPVKVTVQAGVNLGLIINELVTNAAKHAFVGGEGGHVRVTLSHTAGGLRLVVADDGRGVRPEDLAHTGRLGWRLVRSLVAGLDGELRALGGPGAIIEITLPGEGLGRRRSADAASSSNALPPR